MEPARYRIAPAEATDIEDVVELFKAYETHIGVDLSYQDFAAEVSTLPGKYAPPTGQLMIARDGAGRAIGCVALRGLDRRAVSFDAEKFGQRRGLPLSLCVRAQIPREQDLRLLDDGVGVLHRMA